RGRRRLQSQVQKAGAGHFHRLDPGGPPQPFGQGGGQLAGGETGPLRQLQRESDGVLAVLANARSLQRDRVRKQVRVEPAVGEDRSGGAENFLGQLVRRHPVIVSRLTLVTWWWPGRWRVPPG